MTLDTAVNTSLPSRGDPPPTLSSLFFLNVTESFPPTSAQNTPVTTTVPQPRSWTGGLVAEYAVRVLLAVLMVLVNLLVLLTLWSTPSLRCAANWVIGSLAVTDLMVGVVSPAGLLIELQVIVSPLLCRMGYAGVMALTSVSINHLLFVSVDRYLLISRPLRYPSFVTKRRVWLFIGASWLWASALSLPFVLGFTIRPRWDGRCLAELMIPTWLIVVLALLHFVLPLIVMMYVHVAIFAVARRQQKAVKNSLKVCNGEEDKVGDFSTTTTSFSAKTSHASSFSNRAKLRAARLLVLPCGFFYVSWGPWFVTILWAVFSQTVVEPHALERFAQTLAILNSLGNPVLYAVSQPVLGRAMVEKMRGLGRACRSKCCCCLGFSSRQSRVEATTVLVHPDRTESTCV
ncbi:hypothetical protein ACOMHN_037253 [Nucella lapillus]